MAAPIASSSDVNSDSLDCNVNTVYHGTSMLSTSNVKDTFREHFKFYKKRKPPPDLSQVVDFINVNANQTRCECEVQEFKLIDPAHGEHPLSLVECLRHVNSWEAYRHTQAPGFVFICNPFKAGWDRYFVKRCLHDYPCKPNITNLDAHVDISSDDNIWDISHDAKHAKDGREKSLLDQLRWCTLGYHHNWDTKEYCLDDHSKMPADLSTLGSFLAATVGYQQYQAEAAIINYYHHDSTLSGHTDHSEFDHTAPLISISFGQPAVFLLGGITKDKVPLAMYLRHGDVVIMGGDSRLAYHAVPRIINDPLISASLRLPLPDLSCNCGNDCLANGCQHCDKALSDGNAQNYTSSDVDESIKTCRGRTQTDVANDLTSQHNYDTQCTNMSDWSRYATFLTNNRINMNVRQVFRKDHTVKSESTVDKQFS